MKTAYLLLALAFSALVLFDTVFLLGALSSGVALHPQLREHWLLNPLGTILFWTLHAREVRRAASA